VRTNLANRLVGGGGKAPAKGLFLLAEAEGEGSSLFRKKRKNARRRQETLSVAFDLEFSEKMGEKADYSSEYGEEEKKEDNAPTTKKVTEARPRLRLREGG